MAKQPNWWEGFYLVPVQSEDQGYGHYDRGHPCPICGEPFDECECEVEGFIIDDLLSEEEG